MKKYSIYRAPGRTDRDLGKHELIAIEYGTDIDAATNDIIRAIKTDLAENPKYKACEVTAYAPEPMNEMKSRTKRYQYSVIGKVSPRIAERNILVDYGVIEGDISTSSLSE